MELPMLGVMSGAAGWTVLLLAATGVAALLAAAFALFRRLRPGSERAGLARLAGHYYGYRSAFVPDPVLPLPFSTELRIGQPGVGGRARAIWHAPSMPGSRVEGYARRNGDTLAVVLDRRLPTPFLITLDVVSEDEGLLVGVQSGRLLANKRPYAASVVYSRRPLDQAKVGEALARPGAFAILAQDAREMARAAAASPELR